MALITLKEALKGSVEGRYALPALIADGYDFGDALISALEEKGLPAILMIAAFKMDFPDTADLLDFLIPRMKKAKVPLVLHLDHAGDIETIMKAIHHGFTSVMIDASGLPYAENLAVTREVVRLAHACGVSVEAEIGHVATPGESAETQTQTLQSVLTVPEEARRFAEESGVDALAISIGTVHGIYKEEPKLDFDRIAAVRAVTDVPLVMHGGSGLSDGDYRRCVQCGMNKINYFTLMSASAGAAMKAEIARNPDTPFVHEYIDAAKADIKAGTRHLLEVMGTRPLTAD